MEDCEDDDMVIEKNGIMVLVDLVFFVYLEGLEIDYVEDLIGVLF